jgi:hypothetical protein
MISLLSKNGEIAMTQDEIDFYLTKDHADTGVWPREGDPDYIFASPDEPEFEIGEGC